MVTKNNLSMTGLILVLFFSALLCSSLSWGKDYSPNVHWVFCIDTSGSMKERGKLDLLKQITERITTDFIDHKKNIIKTGDRITLFSFDEEVRLETTALYQTENDLETVREKLREMNKRAGPLTFTSEAIISTTEFMKKYSEFFHTNALYVFTDGKSDPYSKRWTKKKIAARKKKDRENFKNISLLGKDHKMNIWLGVLKWEAFTDAQSLVNKMGGGGHLVDLTDFNRLPLGQALKNFAQTVRATVTIKEVDQIHFGTIPYKTNLSYQKKITFSMSTDTGKGLPPLQGWITFDPDNPTELQQRYPVEVQTIEDKVVLNLDLKESDELQPGTYKGNLSLLPSSSHYGALIINPSRIRIDFQKSGLVSFYFWKILLLCTIGPLFLFFIFNAIKRKMPIRI